MEFEFKRWGYYPSDLFRTSVLVCFKIAGLDFIGFNKPIMFFGSDNHSRRLFLKLKQGYQILTHELGSDRLAHKIGKFLPAHRVILLYLNHADLILMPLGLNWKYIVGPSFIDPNVNLIGLYLANTLHRSSEMALERITGDT